MGKFSLKQLFGSSADKLVDSVGNTIDKLSTTDEEKLKAKNELIDTITSFTNNAFELQYKIMELEMTGSWLQRNWRPITMLVFGAIVIVATFFPVQLNEVPQDFWGLLKIGIGGYVGGRTLEKMTKDITKNVDISFKKKKNR